MLDLKVRSIDFIYDADNKVNGVNVRFDSFDNEGSINGSVRITEAEYNKNSTDLVALAELVKTKVKAKMETV